MLTDKEAKYLIEILKEQKELETIHVPYSGEKKKIEIVSQDGKEQFLIDVYRGSIDIYKFTYQERYNKSFPLVRIDIQSDDNFHINPDGEKINGSHLHIYNEAYEMKIAQKIPNGLLIDENDIIQTLIDFLRYCYVEKYGNIIEQRRLI